MVADYKRAIPKPAGVILSHEGGTVYELSPMERFKRFCLFGSTQDYYVTKDAQFDAAIETINTVLTEQPVDALRLMRDIAKEHRAVKIEPVLFAYALALSHDDPRVRQWAYPYLPDIVGHGTALFHLFSYVTQRRKISGGGIRKAFARWYQGKTADQLAYQAVKYKQRDGISHNNILRLVHPVTWQPGTGQVMEYMMGRGAVEDAPLILHAERLLQTTHDKPAPHVVEAAAALVSAARLPREAIPTQLLNEPLIWEALLQDMPVEAMIRNLGKMGSIGLLHSEAVNDVIARLRDEGTIVRSKIHPMKLYLAQRQYAQGRGSKGSLTWTPNVKVIDALDDAFYTAFKSLPEIPGKVLLAIDLSSSMIGSSVFGMEEMRRHEAAAVQAMCFMRQCPEGMALGFTEQPISLPLSPRQRLIDVYNMIAQKAGGGTDIGVPYAWAGKQREHVDAFVTVTDEASGGYGSRGGQAVEALRAYRTMLNQNARAVSISVATYHYAHLPTNDRRNFVVAGFDPTVPDLVAQFLRGEW